MTPEPASHEQRLAALGIALPMPPRPVASYIPARRVGNLLFVSGQLPFEHGVLTATGPVGPGQGVSTQQGAAAARRCAINALAAARSALGTLDALAGVVRVGVWVNCGSDFTEQPTVANGASDLLVEVLGDAGRHARAAVGANALPLGASVEVEVCFEVRT